MKKIIIFSIVIITIIFILFSFWPLKFARNKIPEIQAHDCILVQRQYSSEATWSIVENNDDANEVQISVQLTGNYPTGFNYDVDVGGNTYICYGKFIDKQNIDGYKVEVFNVTNWDILYPIKRNSPISWLFPKWFLCNMDTW